MQEAWVWFLILEDPTCHGAAKPMCHNCWVCAPEPGSHSYWAQVLHLLKPAHPRARALQQEKLPRWDAWAPQLESSPHSWQPEKSPHSKEDPAQPKINLKNIFFSKSVSLLVQRKVRAWVEIVPHWCTHTHVYTHWRTPPGCTDPSQSPFSLSPNIASEPPAQPSGCLLTRFASREGN